MKMRDEMFWGGRSRKGFQSDDDFYFSQWIMGRTKKKIFRRGAIRCEWVYAL